MNKAVLISIRPKWCELIASGKKTIEVRKTAPKLPHPFKCYIYCTKARYPHEDFLCFDAGTNKVNAFYGGGMVIGEFVCDYIVRYAKYGYANQMPRYMKSSVGGYPATEIHYASLQLSPTELYDYGKGKPLFGWHISDLVIYDEPKELSDFHKVCDEYEKPYSNRCCSACNLAIDDGEIDCFVNGKITVKRPPQSWQFVEELA